MTPLFLAAGAVLALLIGLAVGLRVRPDRRVRPALEGIPAAPGPVDRQLGEIAVRIKPLEGQLKSLRHTLDSHLTTILAEIRELRRAQTAASIEAAWSGASPVDTAPPPHSASSGRSVARHVPASRPWSSASSPSIARSETSVGLTPSSPSLGRAPVSGFAVAEATDQVLPALAPETAPLAAPLPSPAQAALPAEFVAPPEVSGPPEARLIELWNQHDWRPGNRAEAMRSFAGSTVTSGWRVSEPLSALYVFVHRELHGPVLVFPFLHIDATLFAPELFDGPASGTASRLIAPAEVRFRDQTATVEQELSKLMQGACTVMEAVIIDRRGGIA